MDIVTFTVYKHWIFELLQCNTNIGYLNFHCIGMQTLDIGTFTRHRYIGYRNFHRYTDIGYIVELLLDIIHWMLELLLYIQTLDIGTFTIYTNIGLKLYHKPNTELLRWPFLLSGLS